MAAIFASNSVAFILFVDLAGVACDAFDAVAEKSVLKRIARASVFARIAVTSRRGKLTSIATAAFGTLALSAVVAVGAKTAVLTRVYVAEGKSILTMISSPTRNAVASVIVD